MRRLYLLLIAALVSSVMYGQDEEIPPSSVILAGTCLNPDSGTIRLVMNLEANCPEADPGGLVAAAEKLGFHSGANNWANIRAWDSEGAFTLENDGSNVFVLTIDVEEYWSTPYADLTDVRMLGNNGFGNPDDPWVNTFEDSTDMELFGDVQECGNIVLNIAETPTCADLNQMSSLVLFSDAGDSESCVDTEKGLIRIDLDYGQACPEADSMGILAGAATLGFHSGANDWNKIVAWDDPSAVQLVNNGSDNFSAIINVEEYYGMPLDSINDIQMLANNGPNTPDDPWTYTLKDPKDGGVFGAPDPCSNISFIISEAPQCDLTTSILDKELMHSFKIAPNPFRNRTYLEFNNPQNKAFELEIMNLSGQKVRTMSGITDERVLIERGNLSAGIFVARLIDADGNYATTKLVVK